MARSITQPDGCKLLPHLLACFPGSDQALVPPPALIPLLSPILRQRVQLLSAPADSAPSNTQGSWLPLLCWDAELAAQLPRIVQHLDIEPHPSSGEIEPPEIESVSYRRLDKETLHARFALRELNLLPTYLWCMGDPQGGGDGWRLSELRPLESAQRDDQRDCWLSCIEEANRGWERHLTQSTSVNGRTSTVNAEVQAQEDEDEDDSYWDMYDRTPSRTPKRPSPAPGAVDSAVHLPSASELEYFARYTAEVQPAMDPHDPTEEQPGAESTLNGNALHLTSSHVSHDTQESMRAFSHQEHEPLADSPSIEIPHRSETSELSHPRPSSPSASSTTNSIERLERVAERRSHAELGIKQHISTSIKSLYRLAYASGIEQPEFERIVRTELDVLGMMDMNE